MDLPASVQEELRRLQAASDPFEAAEANELIQAALEGRKTLSPEQLVKARATIPQIDEHVWAWVKAFTDVDIARTAVCDGHSAPLAMFVEQVLTRPPLSLWHGPRGGGKSFLSALDTHLTSRFNPRHGTRILGGSKAQSAQIYEAIRDAVQHGRGPLGSDAESIASLLKTEATYANGSNVSILAASATSVRGPHVPSLKLDEVDEIPSDLRESAIGMCMDIRGQKASVLMTSTWHRMGGPMKKLIEKGRAGEFPVHTFCAFEVLERCPDERSGPNLERCPDCALMPWCHSDRAVGVLGVVDRSGVETPIGAAGNQPTLRPPKAKRSSGHYSIDSLIQKVRGASPRVFASDYLCATPIASNVWFTRFDESGNVSNAAEYTPGVQVHSSTDCGVWVGSLLFQVFRSGSDKRVHVFGEYLAEDPGVGKSAEQILQMIDERAPGARATGHLRVSIDSAGSHRNPIGLTVVEEYKARGLCDADGYLKHWDKYPGSVLDTLNFLDGLVCAADGSRSLFIHPRCKHLIAAFQNYERAVVDNQPIDAPADPQHPEEEMIDAMRGGLSVEFPQRRNQPEPVRKMTHQRIFK